MTAPSVQLDSVSHHFGSQFALRDISLSVREGESLLVSGSNGSGKTTLLRIIASVLSPSRGKIRWFGSGADTLLSDVRKEIGVALVSGYLMDEFTIYENLAFYARLYGLSETDAKIHDWLDRVGLAHRKDQLVRNCSTGERQRASLARSLLHHPKLIIWDEPTRGLDLQARHLFRELVIERLKSAAFVFSTHDSDASMFPVTRTLLLDKGRAQNV